MSVLVTGSSGFIGSHLMRTREAESFAGLDIQPPASHHRCVSADICDTGVLRAAARDLQRKTVIHLAAIGEVLIPWERLPALYSTNVQGTYNVLEAFCPDLFVLASSSSVYGDAPLSGAPADWTSVNPVGAYGTSKVACELLCREWTRGRASAAVSLRIGNVVGAGCRGLVRYLVRHAWKHPDGSVPASLRGGGKLLRDYIPVDLVVRACISSIGKSWPAGSHIVNLGTGRGLTNSEIFDVARGELRRLGLELSATWTPDPGPGEANTVVLDPASMQELLGLPVPTEAEIISAVEEAVRTGIESARQEARNACFANA